MQAAYAQRYRTLWDRHWWWRSREALLLATIDRLARSTPVGRILDVGCGDGLFFDALARFGEVEGLEPDASLVGDPRWRDRITVGPLGAGLPAATALRPRADARRPGAHRGRPRRPATRPSRRSGRGGACC